MKDTEGTDVEQEQISESLSSTLKILGVKELKEIKAQTDTNQDKIQKAKDKTEAKIQQMQNKVDEYFGRVDLDKLADKPDASLDQIDKSERLMHKIANYIYKELIDTDENEDSDITYVEKIQQAQNTLQSAVEGNKWLNEYKHHSLDLYTTIWMIQSIFDLMI